MTEAIPSVSVLLNLPHLWSIPSTAASKFLEENPTGHNTLPLCNVIAFRGKFNSLAHLSRLITSGLHLLVWPTSDTSYLCPSHASPPAVPPPLCRYCCLRAGFSSLTSSCCVCAALPDTIPSFLQDRIRCPSSVLAWHVGLSPISSTSHTLLLLAFLCPFSYRGIHCLLNKGVNRRWVSINNYGVLQHGSCSRFGRQGESLRKSSHITSRMAIQRGNW